MLSKNEFISFFILLSVSSIFSSSAEAINVGRLTSPSATMQDQNSANFSSPANARPPAPAAYDRRRTTMTPIADFDSFALGEDRFLRSMGFQAPREDTRDFYLKILLKMGLSIQDHFQDFSKIKQIFLNVVGAASRIDDDESLHVSDPLTKKIFPNLFGFFIWDEDFYRSDSRTWPQNNRTADEVKQIFLSWFSSPEEMPRARESLIQNFVQKKNYDRTREANRIYSETLDGFRFASLSSGVRVNGGQAQYYPSVGLRLKTQAPYLNFMNELLDFVEALSNPGMITLVKKKILQVFEDQMTLDGLCIPGFV
ncbi:MAG: hypothetical protein ACRC12_05370 [Holosporales bacterium]